MDMKIFMQRSSNLMAENRLLKLVVLVIGMTVLYNTYMVRKAMNTQRTILVPPVINTEIEIQGDKASDSYIRHFIRYTLNLAFNYTPATARKQFEELLTFYAPVTYPRAKKLFYELNDSIETAQISNIFYIQKISLDRTKRQVEITGLKRQYVQDVKSDESYKTYLVDYVIENGRFMIMDVSEISINETKKEKESE